MTQIFCNWNKIILLFENDQYYVSFILNNLNFYKKRLTKWAREVSASGGSISIPQIHEVVAKRPYESKTRVKKLQIVLYK